MDPITILVRRFDKLDNDIGNRGAADLITVILYPGDRRIGHHLREYDFITIRSWTVHNYKYEKKD